MAIPFQGRAANLLAIIVMKIINQLTTFQFSIYNSKLFNSQNDTCKLKTLEELTDVQQDPVMNIFHTGYVFAVIGGLLANRWFALRTVLGVGGALMSAGMGLMLISIKTGLICRQGFYIFVWLFHPLYMTLVLPCLFYGFVRWSTGSVSRMVLIALYYYAADTKSWIGVFLEPFVESHLHQDSLAHGAIIGLGLSIMFTVLSAWQKEDKLRDEYERPTRMRLIRYFKILTIFTLFAVQIDGHISSYYQEILSYSKYDNWTQDDIKFHNINMHTPNFPRLVNMAGILSASVALALVGAFCKRRSRFLLPESRIQIGIVMAGAVALASFIADVLLAKLGPVSLVLTTSIFCTASFLDGVAEVLAMVAIYEFVLKICSNGHKLLVVGIALSIWSLAYLMRYVFQFLTLEIVLKSVTTDRSYKPCALHALNFLLLAACLAFTRFVSFPMAFTLIEESELEGDRTETAPLLSVA